MTDKELKRLSRAELLELLIEQMEENERLHQQLENTQAVLDDRSIRAERAGSLAEAALSLNEVFEQADSAAKQYLDNMDQFYQDQEAYCSQMEQNMQIRCQKMLEEAEKKYRDRVQEAENYYRGVIKRLYNTVKKTDEAQ